MADGAHQQLQQEVDENSILERTVFVEKLKISVVKLANILKSIYSEKHGENAVVALVRRLDGYEITFSSKEATQECLDNGFTIGQRQYVAVRVSSSDLLVNLNFVSAYVEDSAIVGKLTEIGCTVVSDVRHQKIEGVETGRRRVLVQLPNNMHSLPRAITVKSVSGGDMRIEVFHRNQKLKKKTH